MSIFNAFALNADSSVMTRTAEVLRTQGRVHQLPQLLRHGRRSWQFASRLPEDKLLTIHNPY